MSQDSSFKDFVLDQLRDLDHLECRAMFGGYGLYRDETFFGIMHGGRLYFRTDPSSRRTYTELGMGPFRPNARQTLKSYYEVPADLVEEPQRFVAWAEAAVACRPAKEPGKAATRRTTGSS
jgi:DNA transformation protein